MGANPLHRQRLQELEAAYNKRGWKTHFFLAAASRRDGFVTFYEGNDRMDDTKNEYWGASTIRTTQANATSTTVVAMDLAKFVKVSLPKGSVKLMKMDIEGGEFTVVPEMIRQGALCAPWVKQAFIEGHARFLPGPHPNLTAMVQKQKRCE